MPLRVLVVSVGYLGLWAGLGGLGAALAPALWVSPWYPGHALSMALIAAFGPRYLPLLLVARLVAGAAITSEPALTTLAAGIAVVASYGLAGWVLYARRTDLRLGTLRAAVEFLAAGVAASLVLPAILGPALVATGAIPMAQLGPRMISCAIGDTLAMFGLAPLALRGTGRAAKILAGARLDAGAEPDDRHALMTVVGAATLAAIAASAQRWAQFDGAPAYIVAIPVIWAAFVFGSRGAAAVVAAVNVGVPVAQKLAGDAVAVQDTQLLLAVVSVMGILVGAAVTELRRRAVELAAQRAALEKGAAATRRLYEVQSTLSSAEAIAEIGCYRSDRRTGEVWWSDELYRILRRDPATFKPGGDFFVQITHPEDRPALRELVDRIKSGTQPPGPILTELRVVRGDGALRHLRIAREVAYGEDGRLSHVTGIVEDVTEELATRSALADTEARLSAIAANVPGLVFRYERRHGVGGAFTYMSDGVRRLLGLEPADVMRRPELIFDRIHPDDRAAFEGAMRESARAAAPFELVIRLASPSGDLWMHGVAQTRRAADGTVTWDGVMLDVTAEKCAERELRRNEEHFRFMTALAPMALALIGRDDGRIRYANRACEHMFGYSVGRMGGVRVSRLMADSDTARQMARELTRRGTVVQREIAFRRQDGELFPGLVSLMGGGLSNDDEIIVCGLDVSELKDVEARLARQSRALEDRVRELHCRYVLSRLTHDGARGIDATCRDLVDVLREGWGQGDRLWVRITLRGETYVSGTPNGSEAVDRATIRAGHEQVGEIEIGAADGGFLPAPASAEDHDLLGSAARQVGHMIFEREASARLAQAQRLESIGQLSGGIAHDFNNLLTVIFGNLELAGDRAKGDVSLAKCLANAQQAARRAAELTGQLLAFSRRQALSPEPLELNALIARICGPFRRSLGEGIEVVTELSAAPARVCVDRVQMEATILHLAVNARDAMAGGGRRDLRHRRTRGRPRRAGRPGRGGEARPLCRADHRRHRRGNDARGARPRVRPVLHHQGGGAGHRAGAQRGVRLRQAVGRLPVGGERAGTGDGVPHLPAGRGGCGGRPRRGAARSRRRPGDRRRRVRSACRGRAAGAGLRGPLPSPRRLSDPHRDERARGAGAA